ncbi:MAG: 1-acyl-sn-glycerol-3-phosphate acyltransferase [Trichocoleus desertorum ATA4-8-CV12]|jgi:1-acyl-sn-glycerol-3-phosphate acyltransferase|nr:1-acyl-sn-glycerol-3-phosphate acyltransferase [Trichocoleus desertorum ATA4-8-CV12]
MISFDSMISLNSFRRDSSDTPPAPNQDMGITTHASSSTPPNKPATSISRFSPWLMPWVYPLGRHVVLPAYFRRIEVSGRENLPAEGPVVLAPTHRSRWDALLVPYAAGRDITGHDLRFMVSADEVKGLQGWFIRRLGGFPIDPKRPAIASLRHGVELLENRESLVIFPEGGIFRDRQVHPLKPGLARLALQAEANQPGLDVKIVPISLHYSQAVPGWGSEVRIRIGEPLKASTYNLEQPKASAKTLTADLEASLQELSCQLSSASPNSELDAER